LEKLGIGQQVPKPPSPEPGVPPGNLPPLRQAKFPFPIQRRRRSKIPATRRFRLLPILT